MSALARLRLFRPTLAGATARDRALACAGALAGICVTALIGGLAAEDKTHLLWIVPPMGASAVLLFAVPASPMAQPWAIVGGNVISSLVGVLVAHTLPLSALSAGIAVAAAIGAMSMTRCLHPPGGAAALVGLFAGSTSSLLFPIFPVGLNAVALVAGGWLYHRLSGHTYPHVPARAAPAKSEAPWTFSRSDMAAALEEAGETFDIDTGDLEGLLHDIQRRALSRAYHELSCADLMTKGVISVDTNEPPDAATRLLVKHDVRRLAVLDAEGRIAGVIGLRELARPAGRVADLMSPAATAAPDVPAIELLERFARDRVHAVFVIDDAQRPLGVVTEADWLAVLTRGLK